MIRRFGTLGVGVVLTLSLTTGCVTPSDYATQMPPLEALPRPVQPRPSVHPPITQPKVNQPQPPLDIEPPKPPPPPEIVPIPSSPPEPLLLATVSVKRIPTEANDAAALVALRCEMEKHHPEMLEALQKYDKRTQNVLVPLLSLAARVSEGGVESVSPQEMATLRGQLDQVMAVLRVRTPLSVEKMCYCRRIANYGLYDPLPDNHIFSGGDRRHVELVQLYVEARNFASKKNGNVYETSLGSKLEIRNENEEIVARMDFPAKPDHSLSPRQDYFIHYQFYVPAQMEPGKYKLWITLQDENATGELRKQIAQYSLPFLVCGDGPARAAR